MGAYTKRAFVAVATSICVLAGTAQGAFAASGTAKANRDIVEDASAQASADGIFYVGTASGPLYAINGNGTSEPPSSWAIEEVDAARAEGLIPAELDSSYQANITREEFCHLMAQLLSAQTGKSVDQLLSDFDLTPSSAYADTSDKDILAMSALGIVKGVGNNRFSPAASITREEAAVMLARVTDRYADVEANGQPLAFADAAQISSWAKDAVDMVSSCIVDGNRIMNGTGGNRFDPKGTYTREQSILTSLRLYQFIGNTDFAPILPDAGETDTITVGGYQLRCGEYRNVTFREGIITLRSDGTADYHINIPTTTGYDAPIYVNQDNVRWSIGQVEDYGVMVPAITFHLDEIEGSMHGGDQTYMVTQDNTFGHQWLMFVFYE